MNEAFDHDQAPFAIAATGHRPGKLFGYDLHDPRWLMLGRMMRAFLLERLGHHGRLECISGMALGVDQLYALVALKLRNEGRNVSVTCALPCHGQNLKWKSDEYWRDILERADKRVFVHDGPSTPRCLNDRNLWMIDHADMILAVWNGAKGGTGNCVWDAKRRNVPVLNLYPELARRLREDRGPGLAP